MNRQAILDVNRQLSAEEADAYLDAHITAGEREEVLALVRWFTSRYRTPAERLAYARRAYARWARSSGAALVRLEHRSTNQ